MKYPMWTRCQILIEVEQLSQKFRTLEECPAGYPAGLEPGKLMDLCVACPKAEPQVLSNVKLTSITKRPVPKKPQQKKYPPPRKK